MLCSLAFSRQNSIKGKHSEFSRFWSTVVLVLRHENNLKKTVNYDGLEEAGEIPKYR